MEALIANLANKLVPTDACIQGSKTTWATDSHATGRQAAGAVHASCTHAAGEQAGRQGFARAGASGNNPSAAGVHAATSRRWLRAGRVQLRGNGLHTPAKEEKDEGGGARKKTRKQSC